MTTNSASKEQIVTDIGDMIRAAWTLCHNTANENPPEIGQADWDELSAALDKLDQLPDVPDVVAGPATKAEYALTCVLSVSRPAVKGLEWHGPDVNGEYHAKSVLGVYSIDADLWLSMVGGHFPTIEAAKAAAQSDFEQRILSSLSPTTPTHRHVKRGTEYELIGIGKIQAASWCDLPEGEFEGRGAGGEPIDMREVAIYRSIDDGSLWARPLEEFNDGRFVAITKDTQ